MSAVASFSLNDELENAVRYIRHSAVELRELIMPATMETPHEIYQPESDIADIVH